MPSALTLGALLVALALHADDPPLKKLYDATVKVPEAVVRSGASDKPEMYPTNRLHQGDVVEVVQEMDGGWLAIKPPPRGSFSWINSRFLERDPKDQRIWVVHSEAPVDVLLGSELLNAKPSVVGKKLSPGSIVVAVGQPIDDNRDNDGRFLPIVPPEGELRYVRADQVTPNTPAGQAGLAPPPTAVGAVPPGPPAPAGDFNHPATPAASAPLPPAAGGSSDPRWQEAQRLEQEGKKAEAAQKYTELAQQVYAENHDLAMQCYNRAYFLRESLQGGTPTPPANSQLTSATADNRLAPVPAGNPGLQANYASLQDPAAGAPPQTSTPGLLRVAGRGVDSRPTYVLQNSQGMIQMYVTAQPGVDLQSYVGRNVQLYGPLVYRMDIRAYYMNAQRVTPLQ